MEILWLPSAARNIALPVPRYLERLPMDDAPLHVVCVVEPQGQIR